MTDNICHPADPPGRRDLLKKLAVGAAAVWVAPTIASSPASAQVSGGPSGELSLTFECSPGSVLFVLSVPAQYIGMGYFLGTSIDADFDFNTCPFIPTIQPIDSPLEMWQYGGFGTSGTGTAWIHNGDCVPIASASGAFSCPRSARDSVSDLGQNMTIRNDDGEVTFGS